MIKKHLKLLIITTIITLLPIAAGLILWQQLPEQVPTHWNINGEVDGWLSKPFAVFALPAILAAFHWLCVVITSVDPKKKNHSDKMISLVFWIIPLLSVVLNVLTYATALGKQIQVDLVMPMVLGVLFVIIGNYMPKCKHNYTIGIKISWTLNSEENWNKTHRLAGWVWTIGGLLMIPTAFIGFWVCLPISLVMLLVPTIYSYSLYKKGI